MTMKAIFLLIQLSSMLMFSVSFWSKSAEPKELYPKEYGVDVTFPIHGMIKDDTIFKRRYDRLVNGCYTIYPKRDCDSNEAARMEMNRNQPKVQHNYTEIGFKKMKVPQEVWDPLIAFYNRNKDKMKVESWFSGNTYTNNWESPSYFISVEDTALEGGGPHLKQKIWDGMRPVLEDWTGHDLVESSLYGIRIYKENSVLATHIDRLPLVSSAIIQVDQVLNEPWPVEVYSHDGKAYNITLEPGEMALYESHTVFHGRPFPLNGSLYANIFVHFIPVDHDEENDNDPNVQAELAKNEAAKGKYNKPGQLRKMLEESSAAKKTVEAIIKKKTAEHVPGDPPSGVHRAGHEQDNHDEEAMERHRRDFDERERLAAQKLLEEVKKDEEEKEAAEESAAQNNSGGGRTEMHVAAGLGDLATVEKLVKKAGHGGKVDSIIHAKDANDWQPMHEAARGGHTDTLKYLVDLGADIGAKTSNGGTVLWWAKRMLEAGHPVIEYLEGIGAPEEGEDL